MAQYKLLSEDFLNHLTVLRCSSARRRLVGHTLCVTVLEHLSRNKRTLSSSCIDALDHFDVTTTPHCIAVLNARMRRGRAPRRKVTENGPRDSMHEISIVGYTGIQCAVTRDSCEIPTRGPLVRTRGWEDLLYVKAA